MPRHTRCSMLDAAMLMLLLLRYAAAYRLLDACFMIVDVSLLALADTPCRQRAARL